MESHNNQYHLLISLILTLKTDKKWVILFILCKGTDHNLIESEHSLHYKKT